MILNLNPEQFLLVYNRISDNSNLTAQDLKSKMDAMLLEALSSIDDVKLKSKFSTWIKQEKEKVDHLESELKNIKVNSTTVSDDGLYFPIQETK